MKIRSFLYHRHLLPLKKKNSILLDKYTLTEYLHKTIKIKGIFID